jgi:hypothetical protein
VTVKSTSFLLLFFCPTAKCLKTWYNRFQIFSFVREEMKIIRGDELKVNLNLPEIYLLPDL